MRKLKIGRIWKFIEGQLPILYFENYISYNGNESSYGENFVEIENNTTTIKSGNFQKAGYELKGWSTTPNGEVEYEIGQTISLNNESQYNLYAVW